MVIYADRTRTDASPQRESEPAAEFYDRIAGQYWDQVREVINEWSSHLPANAQPGIRSRLRDRNNDANVYSALWELYLHEMLIGSGCAVEVEQAAGDRGKYPDFLVTHADGQFVLEAIWTVQRLKGSAYNSLTPSLLDAINTVPSPNFYLAVTINKTGTMKPSQRRLKAGLARWLEGLDPDEVMADRAQRNGPLRRHTWEEGDWSISFDAIPRSPGSRGFPSRTIGFYPSIAWFGGESELVLDAVRRKGTKYGELALPFIVAVGHAGFFPEDEDVETALYGSSHEHTRRDGTSIYGRLPNGYWTAPGVNGHERVSGVLVVDNPAPATWATKSPILWHSSNPNSISAPVLPTWKTARLVDGRVEREPSVAEAHTAVGLPAQWPSGDPFPRLQRQ